MKTVFYLLMMAFGFFFVACGGGETSILPGSGLQTIEVTPANTTLPNGVSTAYAATGIFEDGSKVDLTTNVLWSSSDASIATIESDGTVNAISAGITTISARLSGISGSAALTVTDAVLVSIAVTPTNPSVANGYNQQFTATGIYSDNTTQDITADVTWASSAAGIATIGNTGSSDGLAVSVSPGTANITAAFSGVTSPASTLTVTAASLESITVTPTNPSIAKGNEQQFIATGKYSDGSVKDITADVTWSSSDTGVATISNADNEEGVAASVSPGTTDITASLEGVNSAVSTLTVTDAVLVLIEINPTDPRIPLGNDQQFTAAGTYSDGSTEDITSSVIWASTNADVATISNANQSEGFATSVSVGSTYIKASLDGVAGPLVKLTVTDAVLVSIDINPTDPSIPLGNDQQFTAAGTYSDGSTGDITADVLWSSSDTGVATISNAKRSAGFATSVTPGTTDITASFAGVTSPPSTLTITDAALVSIDITPIDPRITWGDNQQFTATGNYSDGSMQDITTGVTWASSDEVVATISSGGLATSRSIGSTDITASLEGVTSPASTLTVMWYIF